MTVMLCTGSWRRQWFILMLIISATCSTASHTSIMMLPFIWRRQIRMIAHTTYMSSTALKHIHSSCWLHRCRAIVPTVCTIWYTLIFYSNICYFGKETRLIIHGELIFVVCYIQLGRPHSVQSNILIFHRWNMSLTILSTVISIALQSSISSKLLVITSWLISYTMILLSIVIITRISSCLLALTLTLSTLIVYLKFLLLYLILVLRCPFILFHAS